MRVRSAGGKSRFARVKTTASGGFCGTDQGRLAMTRLYLVRGAKLTPEKLLSENNGHLLTSG